METEETLDLPKSYGTKKCYDCGLEPRPQDNWWERFVEIDGKDYSVPQCDACGFIMEQEIKANQWRTGTNKAERNNP